MQAVASLPAMGANSITPGPVPAGHNITVKEMWNVAMRNNSAWGIEGYQVPKEYLDAKKLAEISSGKMTRPAPRALKKLDYLDLMTRSTKTYPAPNKYDIVKPWVDEKNKGKAPKHVTKKNSYIDNIIHEAKRRPVPGPGAYNLLKDDDAAKKNGKREVKGSERTNFLCEMEYLSNTIPGPGNYNPREIEKKVKENKMGPTEWRKKHSDKSRSKSALPDGLTVNPFPVGYKTFGKLMEQTKNKEGVSKTKIWGTSSRFQGKKDPKKDPNNFPGPGQYVMTCEWNGKQAVGKNDKKDKNWMNKVTKGIEKSIYY